ncbi:hypothetical protein GCM10011391_24090 [Pullulanibacillus camelliae]|uniref:Uncharacterized protein n=1 Tax=Pullulanibacillus camelliae TaxID=1707096 RepID=A0A8J2YI34_9BACL|nr:hypothetical protein [Pullulanibacillus camelliae]GGE44473.1 hypothetical protein GCM10011391_24090 [Pullulanibacillus camelliae]
MFILIALFIIIGLAMIGYTAMGYNQQRGYSFKNAALRRKQTIQLLIGIGGAFCLVIAWILAKI